jgi:hypothetical protein
MSQEQASHSRNMQSETKTTKKKKKKKKEKRRCNGMRSRSSVPPSLTSCYTRKSKSAAKKYSGSVGAGKGGGGDRAAEINVPIKNDAAGRAEPVYRYTCAPPTLPPAPHSLPVAPRGSSSTPPHHRTPCQGNRESRTRSPREEEAGIATFSFSCRSSLPPPPPLFFLFNKEAEIVRAKVERYL